MARWIGVASVLLAITAGGVGAHGETLLPFENPTPGSRIAEYLSLDPVRPDFLAMADAYAQTVGWACEETGELALHDVYAIQPVVLEDGEQHPSAGVWVYRFSITRCGKRQGLQALAAAFGDGALRVAYSQAGDTLADPIVQRDMLSGAGHAMAFTQTGLRIGQCDSFVVVDTAVSTPPRDLPVGSGAGRDLDGQAKAAAAGAGIPRQIEQADAVVVWEEQWDLRYCGRDAQINVEFWENPYIFGAVGFTVASPNGG